MEDHLYVILWRTSDTAKWKPLANGVLSSRDEVEIVLRAEKVQGSTMQYAWVEGPITSPEAMAEQEAALGVF